MNIYVVNTKERKLVCVGWSIMDIEKLLNEGEVIVNQKRIGKTVENRKSGIIMTHRSGSVPVVPASKSILDKFTSQTGVENGRTSSSI